MALSEIDRRLLTSCLAGESRSWAEFVDRFIGLVIHVVDHTAQARSIAIAPEDREDFVADVFLAIVRDDFRVLRSFRGQSSLATYLTVIARRIVVRGLSQRAKIASSDRARQSVRGPQVAAHTAGLEKRIIDRDEIERMLTRLNGDEAEVVRLYHLEGKSYREISDRVGMPENSIGPTLSRARSKLREANADTTLS